MVKNGKGKDKISPNQRASYRAATNRASEIIPTWPEGGEDSTQSMNVPTEL